MFQISHAFDKGITFQGYHIPRPCAMVFQSEDFSYANPFVDYVEQAKTI
jgi:hypothetical protein